MADRSDTGDAQPAPRARSLAGPDDRGLDVEALRRKRDRMVRAARGPEIGDISLDVALLWPGRVARSRGWYRPAAPAVRTVAGREPDVVSSLPVTQRLRLWHGYDGTPRSHGKTVANTASTRRDPEADGFEDR